jgi:hypothetical protein
MELDTFNVDVAVVGWAPELEQDISSGSMHALVADFIQICS